MSVIDRRRLSALAEADGDGPRVSIYLPTHRAGTQIRQDPIRLKNLLRDADAALADGGLRDADRAGFLAPATALLEKREYWQNQLDGLALFLDADGLRDFRCPRRFAEFQYVGDHFHLKPLLPLLRRDAVFHLLALSLGDVQLYEVTDEDLVELPLGDIPGSLADALGHDLEEPTLQRHGGAHQIGAVMHGKGAGDEDRVGETVRFLQLVDDALRARLGDARAPVVLAGVDELVSRYRGLSKHKGLIEGAVTGNLKSLDPRRLHAEAWDVARHLLDVEAERAAARFVELRGTERASASFEVVGPAAAAGRVESLLVAADREVWGRLQPDGTPEIHDERRPGDVELLDRLAVLGMRRGADVVARRASRLPDGVALGAVMRY